MRDVLLVHGAAHGAWCWRDTVPALARLGLTAKAVDLPGHGADRTPLRAVTLERYADAIVDALDGPTVLVGHSMGGFPITLAAARAPERVAGLIYLCAYLPQPDLSLAQMRMLADEQPLLPAIVRNPDGLSMHFDPQRATALFYHDCPDAVAYARENLCDQPLAPMQTPLSATDCAASVARGYIVCDDDRAIPPAFQDRMAAALPAERVRHLPSSHSPFFSMPGRLATTIADLL